MLCRALEVVLVEVSEMIQHQLHLVLYHSLSLAYSSFILYTLQYCNQLRLRNTRVYYVDDIDGKSHKMEQKLFNQSYKVKITPLVIYGLGGVHTHMDMHTYRHERDFKKLGPAAGVSLV